MKASSTKEKEEFGFGALQSILSNKERQFAIEFTTLTKREKDVLMKTVKLQEEIGELANDVLSTLRLQRKSKLESFDKRNLYEEFADVTLSVLDLANALHVNMDRAVQDKLKKILTVYTKDR